MAGAFMGCSQKKSLEPPEAVVEWYSGRLICWEPDERHYPMWPLCGRDLSSLFPQDGHADNPQDQLSLVKSPWLAQ